MRTVQYTGTGTVKVIPYVFRESGSGAIVCDIEVDPGSTDEQSKVFVVESSLVCTESSLTCTLLLYRYLFLLTGLNIILYVINRNIII